MTSHIRTTPPSTTAVFKNDGSGAPQQKNVRIHLSSHVGVENNAKPARPAHPTRPPRHVRTILPGVVHEQISHLAVELDRSIADLLIDGALLLLRYHGRSEGLPSPVAPKGGVASEQATAQARTTTTKPGRASK